MKIVQNERNYTCTPLTKAAKPSDSLLAIVADMEKENLGSNPIQAGMEGDRASLRRLPNVTLAAAEERVNATRRLFERYQAIDASASHGDNKINYDLLGFVLKQELDLADFDESRIPFTNDSGFFNMLSYVSRQTKFDTVDDYEAYAARLSELPRFFEEHKANMRRGIATDYTASAEIMPGILDMVRALATGKPEDHSFYLPFQSYNDLITESDQSRLKSLGIETIRDKVLPAYEDLLAFLENEYAPKARSIVGIGTNELNRAHYEALVKHFTTLDMTPDEVHQIGLDEVKRIRAEMDEIINETGFTGGFKEFLDFLRTDDQFYVDTPEALLKEAAWIAKRVDGQMPRYFGKLPRLSYGVLPVPDEIAPTYTTGRYWGGNPDNGVAGNYMVNTYNLKQRPLYNLPALTLHEGVPGHHHQISLGQELEDVPKFRQSLYPNAFGEGWGLYSEKLGVEMGIYKTPYENFGRLTYEMWRACRLVVDTGMHWKGWTREQAEACFFENSALAAHNIKTEVDRYISWPGQALAYKIGELKIWELRRLAEKELGADFDIRNFHDAVLSNGGIPLMVLEEQIKIWIKDQKAG
ncbi:MAG: DUF885 domain-containing protein [Hyphomonadaceae bacterium]|nr:DUF885 domain-containing protein [Hyphomonadaceae bacterium]